MAMIDAVVRQLPGVLGAVDSAAEDSFADVARGGLLDCPHYTRPESWRGAPGARRAVVRTSREHRGVATCEQAVEATWAKRPDLIEQARAAGRLSRQDEETLRRLERRDRRSAESNNVDRMDGRKAFDVTT